MLKYPPIVRDYPHFLHGGDYNPEQGPSYPGIIDEDFRNAPLAHVNSFSVGIFSWAHLEPEEQARVLAWLQALGPKHLTLLRDGGGWIRVLSQHLPDQIGLEALAHWRDWYRRLNPRRSRQAKWTDDVNSSQSLLPDGTSYQQPTSG